MKFTFYFDKPKAKILPKRKQMSKKIQIEVLNKNKSICCCCQISTPVKKVTTRISLKNGVFHHILPLCYGGINDSTNICIVCVECHNELHSNRETKEKYLKNAREFLETGQIKLHSEEKVYSQ